MCSAILLHILVNSYLIFFRNNINLQNLNTQTLIHNFEGVFVDQNNVNIINDIEYCFTMPMENGRIVDLNLPQTVSILFKFKI